MTVLALDRYPVTPGGDERFRELVVELLSKMRAAGGILWADAAEAFDDVPSYLVVSEWREGADLAAWQDGEETHLFLEATEVLMRGDVVRRRFADA